MTEKERKELLKYMEKLKKKFAGDKEAAREFLVSAGIYTKKGNLRKPYRHLYFPPEQ